MRRTVKATALGLVVLVAGALGVTGVNALVDWVESLPVEVAAPPMVALVVIGLSWMVGTMVLETRDRP